MSESFTYNYSAERQSEIDAIRKKYLPPAEQENKLEQLRKLDASLTTGALTASMALGIAQEALDLAVNHTKNRIQFGRPLCKNQALSFMMADMETKLNAARNLVYNAAWLMDTKQDASKAASMAKYYTTEAAIEIVNKSLQLHGGYGYSREYEIERLYRDVRITSIYEGSSQVQQMVIAGSLLK